MKRFYFPGCSVRHTARMYDDSFRAVTRALQLELPELEDWNCCGATAYMSIRELTAHGLSARNLALAEAGGAAELITGCSACFTTLGKTNDYMAEDPDFREKVRRALQAAGLDYHGRVKVRHLLDLIVNDVGSEEVVKRVTKPLTDLRVASYYGCQLTRPHGRFDDPENPTTLDELMAAIGAEPVDFPLKAKCCGGMVMNTQSELVLPLVDALLACAETNRAQCIVTPCPLCHFNLEYYQADVNREYGRDYGMPILYFTQLLGLALGIDKEELGIGRELIPNERLVAPYA